MGPNDAVAPAYSDRAAIAKSIRTVPRPPVCRRYQHVDQLLGKRWMGLIVRALLDGPCRFSEFAAHIGVLSDRTLSVRLGELEARGIVERRVDGEAKPVRIAYVLTDKGLALAPVVRELTRWADNWVSDDEPELLVTGGS